MNLTPYLEDEPPFLLEQVQVKEWFFLVQWLDPNPLLLLRTQGRHRTSNFLVPMILSEDLNTVTCPLGYLSTIPCFALYPLVFWFSILNVSSLDWEEPSYLVFSFTSTRLPVRVLGCINRRVNGITVVASCCLVALVLLQRPVRESDLERGNG